MSSIKKITFLLFLLLSFFVLHAADDARLMRYPHVSGDQAVFVYAGNIWAVPSSGGDARQLTTHRGLELFPKLSPDGRWIAFSAEYSGSRQIYVMPSHTWQNQ